jgi:hypothetical protein
VVWVHPYLDATRRVVLQYWYFYPFNDYMSDHEGDWEHINVVLNEDRASIREIHYYFHGRSVRLPQGEYVPEFRTGRIRSCTGGRAYMVADYPMRLINGDHNSPHGNYPYPGEWEAARRRTHGNVGGPGADKERIVPTAISGRSGARGEPGRLSDAPRGAPRLAPPFAGAMGFPSGSSMASAIHVTDVGNRAPFGPAFNAGWNRGHRASPIQTTA